MRNPRRANESGHVRSRGTVFWLVWVDANVPSGGRRSHRGHWLELDIIAAVVIGGASLNGGTGSISGSIIGALIMAVLRSGSSQMNWPNFVQEIIIGIVIILAVGLDKFRQRKAAF